MTRILGRAGILALLIAAGCAPGEGKRCNPLEFSDECGAGQMCVVPANCAAAYCCAVDADGGIQSNKRNCQACPDDGGQ